MRLSKKMKIETKEQALKVLSLIEAGDHEGLSNAGVRVYGNKGRMLTKTACITNLDVLKGQCNPRLSFNYCTVEEIGCPECLATLKELAKK